MLRLTHDSYCGFSVRKDFDNDNHVSCMCRDSNSHCWLIESKHSRVNPGES